jgi:Fe2+ or Zn2+ uptake regulation protein
MTSRNTIQQTIILSAVRKAKCHPSADKVYDLIKADNPLISRATVYRNLNKLAALGQIHKVEMIGGADRFDYRLDEHQHFRCEKCGEVFDVEMPSSVDLKKEISDDHGYDISGYDIVFKGLCPKCQKR